MADNTTNSKELLVLSDQEGNYFAIPRDVVEQHRVTGEQKEQIEQLMGSDVSGYGMLAAPNAYGPTASGPAAYGKAHGPAMEGPAMEGPSAAGPAPAASMLIGAYIPEPSGFSY